MLCEEWQRIDTIDICIAPAQTAPRGQATLAAVLGYCGEVIQVWDSGQWQPRLGWAKPDPVHFARLRPRLVALCDIPDLELFPQRYRATDRVMFRAAVEVRIAQRAFAALAALRSWGIITRPAWLAGILNQTARALNFFGSSLGGMVVRVKGLDTSGQPVQHAWHIKSLNSPCLQVQPSFSTHSTTTIGVHVGILWSVPPMYWAMHHAPSSVQ